MDLNTDLVVLVQPTVPEQAALACAEVGHGQLLHACALLGRRLLEDRGAPLNEHVARALPESVLASVEGQGDAGVSLDALQLAPEAQRRREAHGSGGAVTKSDLRDGNEHDSSRRRPIAEGGREVAREDGVDLVVPGDGHR